MDPITLALAGGSIAGSIFGNKRDKQKAPIPLQTQAQQLTQKDLLNTSRPLAEAALGKFGQPYPGSMLTKFEEAGLQQLGDYAAQPGANQSQLYQLGQSELEKTLSGEDYDPVSGTYYQAYRTAVMRELEEAKDRLGARTSASDKFFGGGRIASEGELEEDTMTQLAMMLGQLFEGERARKMEAARYAPEYLRGGEDLEQKRLATILGLGGLEGERERWDYMQQLQGMKIPLDTATALATDKGQYYQQGYEPSWMESAGTPLMTALAAILGSRSGYGSMYDKNAPVISASGKPFGG